MKDRFCIWDTYHPFMAHPAAGYSKAMTIVIEIISVFIERQFKLVLEAGASA